MVAGARRARARGRGPGSVFEAAFGGTRRTWLRESAGCCRWSRSIRATRVAFGYIRDYFLGSPLLRQLLEGEPQANELKLTNGLTVLCFPCTLRSLRGFSIPFGILDELAYFRVEGQADSDVEIQASVRRGMLNFPAPRLVKISTPYLKGGVLFEDFTRAWGSTIRTCWSGGPPAGSEPFDYA